MRDNLSFSSSVVISVLAAGASLWGCSNYAKSSDVTAHSDAQEMRGAETGGHQDLGPLDAPDQILDLAWLDLEEQMDNWLEWDCHIDCFGGRYCEDGFMYGIWHKPFACWEEDDDDICIASKWKCLSGVCGVQFCTDDDAFLAGLVPKGTPWTPVKMDPEKLSVGGINYYPPQHCSGVYCRYRLDALASSEAIQSFELRINDVFGTTEHITNVTNIKQSEIPVSEIAGVWINGGLLEPVALTLFWLPSSYSPDEGSWGQGFGAGVVMVLADGSTVTVVWMWDEALDGPKLAVSVLPAQGTN